MKGCIPRKEKKTFLCQQQKQYCKRVFYVIYLCFLPRYKSDLILEFLYWHKAITCKKIWGPYSEIFILRLINLKPHFCFPKVTTKTRKCCRKLFLIRFCEDETKMIFLSNYFIYLYQPKPKPVSKSVRMNDE